MKKFLISLAFASFAMFSTAQEAVGEVVVPTKAKSVVTNSFAGNWFVGINAGANFYNGVFMNASNGETILDHVAPALDIYVGKWHTPGYGWRLAYRGLDIKTYDHGWGNKVSQKYEKTAFMNYHFDAMFNVRNLILGYKEGRVWDFTTYVGFGWAGRKAIKGLDSANSMTSGVWTGSISINYGFINSWNITKRLAFNVELSGSFFRNGFSSKAGRSGHDMMWTATAGLALKLGKTGWDNAPDVEALQAIYGGMIDGLQGQLDDALAANKEKQNQIKALEAANKTLESKVTELSQVKPVNVVESIFFAFDSYKIASKKEELNIKAYAEAAKAAGAKVRVIGYADKIGTNEYNNKLSTRRAEAVAKIIKACGVEVEVLVGGRSQEYSDRMLNRRVVLSIAD